MLCLYLLFIVTHNVITTCSEITSRKNTSSNSGFPDENEGCSQCFSIDKQQNIFGPISNIHNYSVQLHLFQFSRPTLLDNVFKEQETIVLNYFRVKQNK